MKMPNTYRKGVELRKKDSNGRKQKRGIVRELVDFFFFKKKVQLFDILQELGDGTG